MLNKNTLTILVFLSFVLGGCSSNWQFNPLSYMAKTKEKNKFSYLEDKIDPTKAKKSFVDSATFNQSLGNRTWESRGRCIHRTLMANKSLMCYATTAILSKCYTTENSYSKNNLLEKFNSRCTDTSLKNRVS